MRRIRLHYIYVLAAVLTVFAASCSSDDTEPDTPPVSPGGAPVAVELSISVKPATAGSSTRAWTDNNAVDGEMMKNWLVVAVKSDGTIDEVVESDNGYGSATSEKEVDRKGNVVLTEDATGSTHTYYSFANISKAVIASAMGFGSADDLKKGATVNVADDAGWTFNVNGNQTTLAGFPNGIPMSNKQQIAVGRNGAVSLEVVRMVSKVQLVVTNNSNAKLRVPYFAIQGITDYKDGTPNLKLLPGTLSSGSGKRSVNLNGNPAKVLQTDIDGGTMGMAYYTNGTQELDSIKAHTTMTYTVYVNESQVSEGQYFNVDVFTSEDSIKAKDSTAFAFTDPLEQSGRWRTIARNETHVLNVNLDKYRVKIEATGFTAIGVVPTVEEDDTLSIVNLGCYGEFHLEPKLINRATKEVLSNDHLQDPQMTRVQGGNNTFQDGQFPFIWWNRISKPQLFGLSMGNYTGSAVYEFTATLTDGTGYTCPIRKRIMIKNTKINFDNLAKRLRRK